MNWWQKALIASVVWIVLVAVGIVLMMGHIERTANGPDHAQAWGERFSELAGMVCGVVLVGIWGLFWKMGKKQTG